VTEPFSLKLIEKMETSQPLEADNPKACQILEGAKQAFLELGYEGASVDEIARRAKVSKGTLYNYFLDKRALFIAVVERECQKNAQRIFQIENKEAAIETVLYGIARNYIELFIAPFAPSLLRAVIAEAQRFPELGLAFYRSGPDLGKQRLMQFLAAAVERGELAIDDLELAAQQFIELCKADLFYKWSFCIQTSITEAEIERVANGAVTTFLKAFGC
jgi:TetR/AcrR family transcriptional regulator, mexJK operon transcriptional repressor